MESKCLQNKVVDNLITFVVIFTSITGWYTLEYIGMNFFWGIYLFSLGVVACLIIKENKKQLNIKDIFSKKYNVVVFIYLLWTTLTYLINYQGKSSILYIFKIWVLVITFLCLLSIHIDNYTEEGKKKFLYKICKYIFILGIVHSIIGIYQFSQNTNTFIGFTITDWPPYNAASLYGNVNGFGTYLFFSIISGLYCCFTYSKEKLKPLIIFATTIQCYMLYLSVARTSIIVTIVFVILSSITLIFRKKDFLKSFFNKKIIICFIIANVLMLSIINIGVIKSFLSNNQTSKNNITTRNASEMLNEKNKEGVNGRQLIWKAVVCNYKSYIAFGDGLKYNIVKHIDVVKVISARSKGATRISYHNTLFRYFASNGLAGLCIFLILYFYVPIKMILKMVKEKQFDESAYLICLCLLCIFLYMQMEEVYLGEVMFPSVNTLIIMAYGSSLLNKRDI